MTAAALQRSFLPSILGASLALAFAFEIADTLPTPFAWHFLVAFLLSVLAGSLLYGFLKELVRPPHGRAHLALLVDGGLAMFVWALASLSLVRGICALLPK